MPKSVVLSALQSLACFDGAQHDSWAVANILRQIMNNLTYYKALQIHSLILRTITYKVIILALEEHVEGGEAAVDAGDVLL